MTEEENKLYDRDKLYDKILACIDDMNDIMGKLRAVDFPVDNDVNVVEYEKLRETMLMEIHKKNYDNLAANVDKMLHLRNQTEATLRRIVNSDN